MDHDTQRSLKLIADAHKKLLEEVAALTCVVLAMAEVTTSPPDPKRVKALVQGQAIIPLELNRGRIEAHAMKLARSFERIVIGGPEPAASKRKSPKARPA